MKKEFTTFCHKVEEALKEYFSEGYEILLRSYPKNNGVVLKGLTIVKKDENVSPNIYLEYFFEQYKEGVAFGDIVKNILDVYEEKKVVTQIDMDFFQDYEKVKTKLICKLIHYDWNEELLKEVPHIKILDLAVVFYCMFLSDYLGNGGIMIRNEHIKEWNITEEELFKDAKENAPKLYPVTFKKMAEVMRELFKQEKEEDYHPKLCREADGNLINLELERMEKAPHQMYILSNRNMVNGAAVLVYEGVLASIGDILNEDFYILPSSIHELIVIPYHTQIEETELSRMVNEVNTTQVEPDEILSNHVYLYQKEENRLISLPLIPKQQNCSGTY